MTEIRSDASSCILPKLAKRLLQKAQAEVVRAPTDWAAFQPEAKRLTYEPLIPGLSRNL